MNSLREAVGRDQMISVNVDPSNILKVLQKMHQKMKEQEERIAALEANQKSFVTFTEYTEGVASIKSSVQEANEKSSKSVNELLIVRNEISKTKKDFETLVDTKFSDLLMSTNMSLRSSISNVESSIETVQSQFEDFKKQSMRKHEQYNAESAHTVSAVQTLSDKIAHFHSEYLKHCKECTATAKSSDNLQQLSDRIAELESGNNSTVFDRVGDMVNERLANLQEAISKAMATVVEKRPEPNDQQIEQLWAICNQNRSTILNSMTELSLHGRKIDVIMKAMGNLSLSNSSIETEIPPVPHHEVKLVPPATSVLIRELPNSDGNRLLPLDNDIRIKEHKQLASTVDGLGDRMNIALQDIVKIKNTVNKNEKDVRDVVLAIIDEFKLIRGNATGLENLPPLNLATCVPSFFNNPSFTFGREEGSSGCSSACESGRSMMTSVSNEYFSNLGNDSCSRGDLDDVDEPARRTRKVSGLLHLVCRPESKAHGCSRDAGEEDDNEDPDVMSISRGSSKLSKRVANKPSLRRVGFTDQPAPPIPAEQLEEVKNMMNTFMSEKDDIMSAVDRKVDRDMVERLFNKFRTIVMSLNDRVNEMSGLLDRCATQQEVQAVAKVVTHIPAMSDKASGVKIGPECLFCGRAKSSLAGQVPASTALRGAGVTTNIQTANLGNFVYGDGSAYRGAHVMESFPHFKLPLLKGSTKRPVTHSSHVTEL